MKPEFLSPLIAELLNEATNTWQLVADLKYQSAILNGVLTIPATFITDFASVPRVPFAYLLAGNTAHAAAVVHDYLYGTHLVPKTRADRTFLEAMKVTHITKWRRWLMYLAVVLAGGSSYKSGPERFTKNNKKIPVAKIEAGNGYSNCP